MVKEVVEQKVFNQLDEIVNCFVDYVGTKHFNSIEEKRKNIEISLVRVKGKVLLNDSEFFVGDEPVCVKDDGKSYILLPLNVFGDNRGNVIFTHCLIHALSEDYLLNNYSDFCEVLVDYMANDVSKMLEENNINITFNDNPIYESGSLYSKLFHLIDEKQLEDKEIMIDSLIEGKEIDFDELASKIEQEFLNVLEKGKNQNKIKR